MTDTKNVVKKDDTKKDVKTDEKKMKPIELEIIQLKGITTSDFFIEQLKTDLNNKFGATTFPLIIMSIEKEKGLIILSHEDKKSLENKILSMRYSPEEISAKTLIELKEFFQKMVK